MTLGERIRLTRESKQITQEELAKVLHTTKQSIYKYETGIVTNIPSDKIESIASYLGVTEAYLMGWESNAFTESEEEIIRLYRQADDETKKMVEKILRLSVKK